LALPAQLEPMPAWRAIRDELRRLVGDTMYEIWIAQIEVEGWDGELLVLKAPAATQDWISDRFGRALEKCARKILGAATRIAFAGPKDSATRTAGRNLVPTTAESGSGLNPRYSFDQFIIGEGNRLAHAAALAVAELPGQAYNPLFLYAPPGLGKTHLLHAIGNYVLAFGGGASVRYTTAEAFTNHFLAALGSRSLEPFKRAYRDVDVLLIDDVQFLAAKAKTEEEFFYTFNALYESGRQLVLTCDRLPRSLVAIEERLRERFEAGLVADIKLPNQAMRVAILRKRAELDELVVEDPGVFEVIAARVTGNIRTLEGALIRVVAHHSLTQSPIDVALATEVMDAMYPRHGSVAPSLDDVKRAVVKHYRLSVDELVSPSRTARIAWPRQVAIHIARELCGASLPVIGESFGGRSHATVLHACKRVSERLSNDQQADDDIAAIKAGLLESQADRDC
jgi:chromosomal replication initiator protein